MRQIDPAKHNTRIRCRWAKRQFNPLAAVQADAYGFGEGFEGSLSEHVDILNFLECPVFHALFATGKERTQISIRLFAQKRRDFKVIHAARRQRINLGSRLCAIGAPYAGHSHVAVVRLA